MNTFKYAALFCRGDSAYKKRGAWDVYDIDRDALNYTGGVPCVCHPPCRAWGMLSHMAHNVREGEKELATWSIDMVRRNGGIIEHPAGSRLFKHHLPDAGMFPDEFGGFTIEINQFDFGHVASKPTKLYICGINKSLLPKQPAHKDCNPTHSITGQVPDTLRCTQYQREYTPEKLIDYFEEILNAI